MTVSDGLYSNGIVGAEPAIGCGAPPACKPPFGVSPRPAISKGAPVPATTSGSPAVNSGGPDTSSGSASSSGSAIARVRPWLGFGR